MPIFGAASQKQRATLHPRLQMVLDDAIQYIDFSIIEGHRNQADQEADFKKGLTKLHYPNGRHNSTPSKAADCAPYPIDWKEGELPHLRFAFMMGVIWQSAKRLGVKIRFGMDWNRNLDPRDESFLDLPHVELDE